MKIYIGNLSYQTNEDTLRDFLTPCGDILEVKIIVDRDTNRSKGFAFVTFDDAASVDNAIKLSGETLDGRTIRIDRAQERSRSDSRRR